MNIVPIFLLLTLLTFVSRCDPRKENRKRYKQNDVDCKPKSLVKYNLAVQTLWSKQTFPKMYPTYRPHAQWSSLVGRTHGPQYKMWEIRANATLGVKLFAEQGVYNTRRCVCPGI